jgi:uncharacterized protein
MHIAKKSKLVGLVLALSFSCHVLAQIKLETPNTESILYLGEGNQQALVVGFAGAEGGNAWTSDYWKKTRDQFIEKGYAFLAIGYFGAKGTPDTLQKIAIENIYKAITIACKNKKINKKKIAMVGGSRGADLALQVASHYKNISCVVSMLGSHVTFPGNTNHFTTSTWTFKNKELPFVPVNEASVPYLIKHDLRGTFEAMLQDSIAERDAAIQVEKINGPILFLSATKDEICPSTPMAEKMMTRLKNNAFKFHSEHIPIEGKHTAPYKHFDLVLNFLEKYF